MRSGVCGCIGNGNLRAWRQGGGGPAQMMAHQAVQELAISGALCVQQRIQMLDPLVALGEQAGQCR